VTAAARVKHGPWAAERNKVGPDVTDSPRVVSCPSCGAALRPDATWCSLCFHDLRAPAAPPEPEEQVVDPLTSPLLDVALPRQPRPAPAPAPEPVVPEPVVSEPVGAVWPCSRCGTVNELGSPLCTACGAGFLAGASDKPELVLPGVGNLHAMSRGQRAGLAFGLLLVVLLPLALITYLSTGSPPKDTGPASTPSTIVSSP
jgi:Double zinc ribbon